jgi:hypothetical protein
MLTAPATALASHNSLGVDVQLVEATEYDPETGELAPDVSDEIAKTYHGDAGETGADVEPGDIPAPRPSPEDQSGQAYDPDSCLTYAEDEEAYQRAMDRLAGIDDWAEESQRLQPVDPETGQTVCWVGYLDLRHQYVFGTSGTGTGSDLLYSVNPEPGDDYCRGEEDTEETTGNDDVDTVVTNVQRTQDSECDGGEHNQYLPGTKTLGMDTTLVEAGTEAAVDAANLMEDTGSGMLTLPNTLARYVYAFGQPHPAVDTSEIDGDQRLEAGSGPFGPNPLEGGDPIRDLTGACGVGGEQRTEQCKLLTPQDLRAYDYQVPSGEGDTARLCNYEPSYFSVNPGTATSTPCGVSSGTGATATFLPHFTEGGLGVSEDTPTYAHTMPGWHGIAWLLNHRSTTFAADFGCDGGSLCHDYFTDERVWDDEGAGYFAAVNPKVPQFDDPETRDLWCVLPNVLTDGSGIDASEFEGWDEDISAEEDPGFYGTFQGAAFDADVHRHVTDPVVAPVHDETHDTVREVVRPVQDVAPHRNDVANPETLNDPAAVVSHEDAKDIVEEEGGEQAGEAVDRADYLGSNSYDPDFGTFGEQFLVEPSAGLGCNPDGFPQYYEKDPPDLDGALNFDAGISNAGTTTIKDPTIFADDGAPAGDDETYDGAWQADAYSFGGSAIAHVDTVGSGEFDECSEALGEPQPQRDNCVWRGVWDAYNDQCVADQVQGGEDLTCGDLLDNLGYDTETGVGVFYTLEVTGPMATYDVNTDDQERNDRTNVLGLQGDPSDQNCVVGTSVGFDQKLVNGLASQIGVANSPSSTQDLVQQLCADADGETAFIADSFGDGGSNGGSFGSAANFAKLTPTPSAVQDAGFGADDELCMHGVWSIQAGQTADDTAGNMEWTGGTDGDLKHFEFCVPLSSQAR